jgi:hypothetical protein
LILVNRSQTALFAGIALYGESQEGVLKAEIGFIFPSAPARLELYLWPMKHDSRPFGVYQLKERPKLMTTLINTLLFQFQEAQNDSINESSA